MYSNNLSILISKYSLYAIFALHPVFLLFWYKGHYLLTLAGLLLVVMFEVSMRSGRIWCDKSPVAVYLFFLLPVITVIWAKYPTESLWRSSLVLVNLAIFHLALRAGTKVADKLILTVSIIVPIVLAATFTIIYYKYGTVRPLSSEMHEEIKSFSNVGPAMVVLCIPYLIIGRNILIKPIWLWSALAASIFVVILSGSRSGLIMLLMAFALTIYFYPAKLETRVIKFINWMIVVFVVMIIMIVILGVDRTVTPLIHRFESSQLISIDLLGDPSKDSGDYSRALMYSEGVAAIRAEPLLGIGYGGLIRFMEENHDIGSVSHNLIITIWGEMGVFGIVIMLWLLISTFGWMFRNYKSKHVNREYRYLIAATLVSLMVAFVHAQFRPLFSNPMFPLILAQVFTIKRYVRI